MTRLNTDRHIRICDVCGYVFDKDNVDGRRRHKVVLTMDSVRNRYDLCQYCAERWVRDLHDRFRGEQEFRCKVYAMERIIKAEKSIEKVKK